MKTTIKYAACIFSILFSTDVFSFKVDTHVWIGQQIINDLEDDGRLSIKLDNKTLYLDVRDDIRETILNNKSAYLMGNIGPDAAPDAVVGQTLIHPGGKDHHGTNIGWQTNDWLQYLLDNAEYSETGKAFTYGFIGHAAADVFAHTYVNQYAGDVFDLSDESLVEQRHFILESYIGKKTPALKNHLGQAIGAPWEQVDLNTEYATFIRDVLIYDDEVQKQFRKAEYATHLAVFAELREAVDSVATDGIWNEIDKAILKLILKSEGIELPDEVIEEILSGAQSLIDIVNGKIPDEIQDVTNSLYEEAKRLESRNFELLNDSVNRLMLAENSFIDKKQALERSLTNIESRLRDKSCSIIDEGLDSFLDGISDIADIANRYTAFDPLNIRQAAVDHVRDYPLGIVPGVLSGLFSSDNTRDWSYSYTGNKQQLTQKIREELISNYEALASQQYAVGRYEHAEHLYKTVALLKEDKKNEIDFRPYLAGRSKDIMRIVDSLPGEGVYTIADSSQSPASVRNETGFWAICNDINNIIDEVRDAELSATHRLQNEILQSREELLDSARELRTESINALDTVRNLNNAIIDLVQLIGSDTNPVQALLLGWRDDIDLAMLEYSKAASQSIVNTMNPSADPIEPMTYWFKCHYAQLLGIPSSIGGCDKLLNSVKNLTDSLEEIAKIISEAGKVGLNIPGLSDVLELKDKFIGEATDKVKEEIGEEIEGLLPDEVKEIIALLDTNVDDKTLNHFFTKLETISQPKGLIMIDDMADRVKAEMHLTSSGTFDPEKYAVIYNSVVLAKLSLLDRYGFEQLAEYAGSTDHQKYFSDVDNIVAQAFGNIDGNHHWMPVPPPIPNSFNHYPPVSDTYSSDRSAFGEIGGLGFVLWKEDMREKIFRKIFIGPISPGIDAPHLIGKERIVESSYPYQVCNFNHFPDDIKDRKCISAQLIPILRVLFY